jgi:hypothetical protein
VSVVRSKDWLMPKARSLQHDSICDEKVAIFCLDSVTSW